MDSFNDDNMQSSNSLSSPFFDNSPTNPSSVPNTTFSDTFQMLLRPQSDMSWSSTNPSCTIDLPGFSASSSSTSRPLAPTRLPKKRPRASKRAPTTVLATDTSNFRQMVQEFTGIPSPSVFSNSRLDHLLRPFSSKLQPLSHPPSNPFASNSSNNTGVAPVGLVGNLGGYNYQPPSQLGCVNSMLTFQTTPTGSDPQTHNYSMSAIGSKAPVLEKEYTISDGIFVPDFRIEEEEEKKKENNGSSAGEGMLDSWS